MNPLYVGACILFAYGTLQAVMPRGVRRDILFGVTTRAEFRATTEARKLLNRSSANVSDRADIIVPSRHASAWRTDLPQDW